MNDSTLTLAAPPRRLRRRVNAVALLSAAVLLFWLVAAGLGPSLMNQGGGAMGEAAVFAPITAAHWFGTDFLGRDVLARVVQGTRYTVGVALSATLLASGLGT
ncbi:MAG: ABC transporter permease, partial [Rhizobacter sp.]